MTGLKRPSGALLAAAGLALVAAFAWQLLLKDGVQRRVEAHFASSPDALSLALAVHRIHLYGLFIAAVAVALALVAVAISQRSRLEEVHTRVVGSRAAGPLLVVGAGILAALGSEREWRAFGSPCWDDYCGQADVYRAWILHPSPVTWAAVTDYLHHGLHSNSPLAPLLTAIIGGTSGLSTVTSYRVLVGLATVATLATFWFLLLPRAEVPSAVRPAALVMLSTSLVLVRSALFPQTDALLMLWVAVTLALALERTQVARWWHWPAALLLLASGLLLKVSFAPALALIPLAGAYRLWAARQVGGIRPLHAVGRLGFEILAFAVLPYLAYRGFQVVAGSTGTYARELAIAHTADSWLPLQLETLLQAALFPIVLFLVGWPVRRRVDVVIVAWVAVYVATLLVVQASGFDRYQLPVLPALVLLASRGLECLQEVHGAALAWVVVLLLAALNYLALGLGLYF